MRICYSSCSNSTAGIRSVDGFVRRPLLLFFIGVEAFIVLSSFNHSRLSCALIVCCCLLLCVALVLGMHSKLGGTRVPDGYFPSFFGFRLFVSYNRGMFLRPSAAKSHDALFWRAWEAWKIEQKRVCKCCERCQLLGNIFNSGELAGYSTRIPCLKLRASKVRVVKGEW